VNYALKNGMYSLIPEVFVFEDKTQITLHATNMDMDRAIT
jgi:hypothetical protein